MSSAIFNVEEFAGEWIKILQLISSYGFSLPTLAPIAYNCPFDLKQSVMIGTDGGIHFCSSSDRWMTYVVRNVYFFQCVWEAVHISRRLEKKNVFLKDISSQN